MTTKFLPKIFLKKFEHHSERWETTAGFVSGLSKFWVMLCPTNLTKTVEDDWSWSQNVLLFTLFHQPDKSSCRWLELVPKCSDVCSLPPTSCCWSRPPPPTSYHLPQRSDWCSVPPTCQKQLKMVKAGIIYHMLIDDRDWGLSILVNGILYFRLFGHLEMTSSKYQNVKINFDSGSNLRRALGNMYHHVIHDSLRQARVSCLMEGFPRVWVSQGTPKQPYQLCFELLLLPGAWNHVSPCDTWF